jgi:hypothetical protein
MATTIEGQSIYVGQIVKKVTVPNADIPATASGTGKIIGPVFEMNHKDKVTVAVRVVSGPDISNVQLMRVFSDGVASQESISAGGFAADDGPTFAVTYNVPKFRIDYEIPASTGADSVVLIEVEGGVGA